MTKLQKIQFLLEELGRQIQLYHLDALIIIGEPETQKHTVYLRGKPSDLLQHLGHLLDSVRDDTSIENRPLMHELVKEVVETVFKEDKPND